jgi:multidrug resistance protein, MATE family
MNISHFSHLTPRIIFFPRVGLIFALDTYISQAFGAKNFRLIGIVFQNCMVICTLLSIPITIAWMFTEDLLLLLGQGEAVSKLAGDFTKWSIPGVLPYLYYRTIMRYLQNQHIMMPGTQKLIFCIFDFRLFFGFLTHLFDS